MTNQLDVAGAADPSEDIASSPSEGSPIFIKIENVNTTAAIAAEDQFVNVLENIKRNLPRFHELPGFKEVKQFDQPIALVGGGPSLLNPETLEELRAFAKNNPIIACGSAHDFLVKNYIKPTYCTICDPDAVMAEYIQYAADPTIFLVSSSCDPKVFETLEHEKVYLWHCYSDELGPKLAEIEPSFEAVGGGCTIGLRSISIAIMLGYSNIHFWGFDSCMSEEQHHAYDFATDTEVLGDVHKIRLGKDTPGDKVYLCAGYHVAQVKHFMDFFKCFHEYFAPTFHGEGLLRDLVDLMMNKRKLEAVNGSVYTHSGVLS